MGCLRVPVVLGSVALLAAGLVVLASGSGESREAGPAAGAGDGGPVVLELFTSQGCSSCPPADRLLSELADSSSWGGRVIPLAFHVDYWNYIGWTDPFSSEDWSQRQRRYARALASNRVYTPQLVVDGRTDCVGSQRSCVLEALEEAAKRAPAGQVHLDARLDGGDRLLVRAGAERLTAGGAGELRLMLAVFESDLTTPVEAGENARRTLHNDFVVRSLRELLLLPAEPGSRRETEVEVELEPGWDRSNLGVAAFLQEPGSYHIRGAAALRF